MGWYQLLSIQQTNELYAEEDAIPIACPNDGQPLEAGPDGFDFCPFDGWRPNGAPSISAAIRRARE